MLDSHEPHIGSQNDPYDGIWSELKSLGIQKEMGDISYIKKFTPQAREWLIGNHFDIVLLPGNSLEYWHSSGKNNLLKDARVELPHQLPAYIRAATDDPTEVAIDRRTLYLPDSIGKNWFAQEKLLADFSSNLPRAIKPIVGSAAQYVDLIVIDFLTDAPRKVFGPLYNRTGTRTSSGFDDISVCSVGISEDYDRRIVVNRSLKSNNNPIIGLVPLIVPNQEPTLADLIGFAN